MIELNKLKGNFMHINDLRSHSHDYLLRFDGSTLRTYTQAIRSLFEFLTRHNVTDTKDITVSLAEAFKKDLEMDYKPKTASMYITTTKDFFNYLATVTGNPTLNTNFSVIRPTKIASRAQKTAVLTEKEVQKMLSVAVNYPDPFQATQLTLMTVLMVNLGLRLVEVSHLRVNDFKLQSDRLVLTVNGEQFDDGSRIVTAKNMRFRYITLSPEVAKLVTDSFSKLGLTDNDLVIQGQDMCGNSVKNKVLNPSSILRRIEKLAVKAGIDKAITPHSLRRTCATILYLKGASVEQIQRLLGHENSQTTHRYIDMLADIQVSADIALNITSEAV